MSWTSWSFIKKSTFLNIAKELAIKYVNAHVNEGVVIEKEELYVASYTKIDQLAHSASFKIERIPDFYCEVTYNHHSTDFTIDCYHREMSSKEKLMSFFRPD